MRRPLRSLALGVCALALPGIGAGQEGSSVVLFDNGPLLTHPVEGCAGADLSAAQNTTLGLTSRGFNHSVAGAFRVADDFEVTEPGWELTEIELWAYQGGSTTASPITAVNFQIWNGPPNQGGSAVVCGDPTTNRMLNTAYTGMYRALLSEASADCTRPLMVDLVDALGCVLAPGHYFLDWQTDGDPAFTGPWAAPVSIVGQTTTGDALQQVTGVWQPVVDAGLGTPLGLPFVLHGVASGLVFRDGFESNDTSRWSLTVP